MRHRVSKVPAGPQSSSFFSPPPSLCPFYLDTLIVASSRICFLIAVENVSGILAAMPRREAKGLSSIMSDVREKRARRAENRQPFFVLKLTVGICSAIIIYACYVYIGRLCVPMLKQSPGAMGSRAMGGMFVSLYLSSLKGGERRG